MIFSIFAILAAGILCIWLEFVVPSHGLLALCFLLLCVVAMVMAVFVSLEFAGLILLILMVIIPTAMWMGFRYYPKSPIARRIFLKAPRPPVLEAHDLSAFRNKCGISESVLRPSGVCIIENQRLACISDNAQIEAGERVCVVGISGNNLIVKRMD